MPQVTGPDGKVTVTITSKTAGSVTVTATARRDAMAYADTVGSPKTIVFTGPTPRSPSISLSVTSLPEGASLNIMGTGWAPSEQVHLTVQSTPVDLGVVTADANGNLPTTKFTVPAGFGAGAHTVTAVGATSGTRTAGFTVTAAGGGGGGGNIGPRVTTGGSIASSPAGMLPAVVASLLALIGLGLWTLRRRVTTS